jgi:hypothetical protein
MRRVPLVGIAPGLRLMCWCAAQQQQSTGARIQHVIHFGSSERGGFGLACPRLQCNKVAE